MNLASESPRISIVTPSFNQAEFLEETMRSVLDQNYPNLEYVVIDGGSTDDSPRIIESYADRLAYWVSEKDEGHGHALNKGFAKTTGEIMAWLNSDDKYTPWAFQVVSQIFQAMPHVNWIVGHTGAWNRHGALNSAKRNPKNIHDFLLGNYNWIQQESVFWRRSLWEQSGGYINQKYRLMVDGELWTRFMLHDPLYSVDGVLSGYRTHDGNRARNNYQACKDEMEAAIEVMRDKVSPEVLRIHRPLQLVHWFTKVLGTRFFPTEKIGHRLVQSAYDAAMYHFIYYDFDHWAEMRLPYSVVPRD